MLNSALTMRISFKSIVILRVKSANEEGKLSGVYVLVFFGSFVPKTYILSVTFADQAYSATAV